VPKTIDLDIPVIHGRDRFQFVDLGQFESETAESVSSFVGDGSRPTVDGIDEAVYTWDYFRWLRTKKSRDAMTESIGEYGLGYCGACSEFMILTRRLGRWECPLCGYRNNKLYDKNWGRKQ
jgi:hypothetical protein